MVINEIIANPGVNIMYIDMSIREYLDLVENGGPIPGGGSVAALVSGLGGALTLMTSNFSIDKKYFKELDLSIQQKVKQSHQDIKKCIEKLSQYVDEDAKGFASVIAEYEKQEIESKQQKKKRIEESYKRALKPPLNCSQECLKLLKLQDVIIEYGNDETITDVGIGVILVYAAIEGCLISVKINLNYIEDENYTKKIQSEVTRIYKESSGIKKNLIEKIDRILESSFDFLKK